ncbi:MAG TPA: AMP-binding protein, partial [Smithella sp.]|nr:AMP-binding protein [Smithella sp.]
MADAKVQLKEIYPIPEKAKKKAWISGRDAYDKLWKKSVEKPEEFWAEIAEQQVTWFKKWDKVMDYNFDIKKGPIYVKFFEGGKLNVSYNCLDRHLEKRGNQVAIQWEGNEPGEERAITYKQLHEEVCKFANVLKAKGVQKGDRVCLYMPMVPELGIAALACSRIGAVHCIVFGGFSADALRDRIVNGAAKVLVVCDGTFRGSKAVPQKATADEALKSCPSITSVIVVNRVGDKIKCDMTAGRDTWYHEEVAKADAKCEPEWMDAEDPLFILYTSGST